MADVVVIHRGRGANDVVLIRDEKHAAAILVSMREKQYASARKAFRADDPHATSQLLDAAMKLIDAYQKQREIAGR